MVPALRGRLVGSTGVVGSGWWRRRQAACRQASLQVRRARPGGRGAAQTLQVALTEVLRDGIVARGRLGWGGLDAGFGLAAALPVALLQLFGHDR